MFYDHQEQKVRKCPTLSWRPPQERITNRLRVPHLSDHLGKMPELAKPPKADLSNHLPKMPELAKLVNTDLSKGFTVSHVAEEHDWTEPMACPQCLCMDLSCAGIECL